MEIHSVLPEERARDEKGEPLPWGYRYADSTRNSRQPEESGPFGRNRSVRLGSRTSRTRTGTTPVRQKENSAVADFSRLFAKEQAKEDEKRPAATGTAESPRAEPDTVATECVLYGYPGKSSEWKVLSRYESIVAPSYICEDYSREDPNLVMANSPSAFGRSTVIMQRNLSRDALKKSRVYKGGQHWIKVTFESFQAAERACYFSPVDVDGCMVHCEMWQGKPPADLPLPRGADKTARTIGPTQSKRLLTGKESAVAGFERAMTLPRSHTLPDVQYGQPADDASITSATASSATATEAPANIRSRSTPQLPSQTKEDPTSTYMTHIPTVKRAVLRPVSEALPPQSSLSEKVLRSIPVLSWLIGSKTSAGGIAEGPILREDGTWDEKNSWYWSFWYSIDRMLGTDFCGLKEE